MARVPGQSTGAVAGQLVPAEAGRPAPLLKSRERTSPQLGWPRTTDSLCPTCVRETRDAHPVGRTADRVARQRARRRDQGAHPRARRQGHHREDLPAPRHVHRHAGDQPGVPAPHRIAVSRAATFRAVTDTLHNHGTSSIKHGRGAVLTIDLTNRCNMMCDPCFMDANQVGYVHELTLDEVKKLLDDASASSRGGR